MAPFSPSDFAMPPWADVDNPADRLIAVTRDRHAARLDAQPALNGRLRAHVPAFWRAFAAVYGDGVDAAAWAVRALDAALDGAADRPDRLRALDRRRAEAPGWFQHQRMIGLMAYTDHFAGTLSGVRAKIPYLQELGITYLHLMPLLKPREGPNDGGYAVQDYRAVNPALGTMDDLRALADALHDADMILVADLVMNHTAREHAWARAACAGDARYRAFYYTFADRTTPDRYEQSLPEVFPDFAPGNFTYVDALARWVWTTFYDFQWDLNYRNPDVFVHMLREMLFLANVGIDALRLDAVPYLWKEMGTNCQNRPEGAPAAAGLPRADAHRRAGRALQGRGHRGAGRHRPVLRHGRLRGQGVRDCVQRRAHEPPLARAGQRKHPAPPDDAA